MTFHHVGIPTAQKRPGETYLAGAKLFITDADASPYHIEWVRFEADSPMPEAMKTNTHVAFFVDDLKAAMAGKAVLVEPFDPMPGLTVAFVIDDGAVLELMQKTA